MKSYIKTLRLREYVAAFPTEALDVGHFGPHSDSNTKELINSRVVELLMDLSPIVRRSVAPFITSIRQRSFETSDGTVRIADRPEKVPRPRPQAYLYGPPGTGKTTFVENLGKSLGLPVCHLSLADNKKSLFGDDVNSFRSSQEKTEEQLFRAIFNCFVNGGVTNPIIFFDEAGDLIQSLDGGKESNNYGRASLLITLKLFLNAESSLLPIMRGEVKLDMSKATIILAGNYEIKDKALKSRITTITFDALTPDQKARIIDESITQIVTFFRAEYGIREASFIGKLLRKYEQFILQKDIETNPGGRISKQVVSSLASYGLTKYLSRKSTKDTLSEESVQKVISRLFDSRMVSINDQSSDDFDDHYMSQC
jgi:ATP-dependent Lon protease